MAAVKPIPEDYPRVTPYLCVDGAAEAIEFYGKVLGTTERFRMDGPPGKIGHAELDLGGSVIMLSDPFPETGLPDPKTVGGTPVAILVYVEDVDDVFAKALANGAREVMGVENQFYGDRTGSFDDPWGHRWSIATHVEDVSPEEMSKRAAQAMSG